MNALPMWFQAGPLYTFNKTWPTSSKSEKPEIYWDFCDSRCMMLLHLIPTDSVPPWEWISSSTWIAFITVVMLMPALATQL